MFGTAGQGKINIPLLCIDYKLQVYGASYYKTVRRANNKIVKYFYR
jgi:hypothetical protein